MLTEPMLLAACLFAAFVVGFGLAYLLQARTIAWLEKSRVQYYRLYRDQANETDRLKQMQKWNPEDWEPDQ